jgi:uncharacterized membrane protein
MLKRLGRIFISGFFTLLPIIITIWVLTVMFSFADGILGGYMQKWTGMNIPGLGIIVIIIASFIVGVLSHYFLGQEFIHLSEEIINKLPIVNTVYSSAKKINDVLFMQKEKGNGKRVCFVEYPRKGIWSLGFATSLAPNELKEKTNIGYTAVFIPNTPAPATGFTIMVPTAEIIFSDMSMEAALQVIISGGAITK